MLGRGESLAGSIEAIKAIKKALQKVGRASSRWQDRTPETEAPDVNDQWSGSPGAEVHLRSRRGLHFRAQAVIWSGVSARCSFSSPSHGHSRLGSCREREPLRSIDRDRSPSACASSTVCVALGPLIFSGVGEPRAPSSVASDNPALVSASCAASKDGALAIPQRARQNWAGANWQAGEEILRSVKWLLDLAHANGSTAHGSHEKVADAPSQRAIEAA